jgi:hypothetical protein
MVKPALQGKTDSLAHLGFQVLLVPKAKLEKPALMASTDCLVLQAMMARQAKKDTQVKKVQRVHVASRAPKVQKVQMDPKALQAHQDVTVLRERLGSLVFKVHLVCLVHGDLQVQTVLPDRWVLVDHLDHQDLQVREVILEEVEKLEPQDLQEHLANLAKTANKD